MRAAIKGFGSIGKRHAALLSELGFEVSVLSPRAEAPYVKLENWQALVATNPDYVVIASITSDHARDLEALAAAEFKGKVLVEKPLFAALPTRTPTYPFTLYIAYQLRFHPHIQRLKKRLQGKTILSVKAHTGQHLSQWRPDRDMKQTYSAKRAEGGGVLRDLSHELDLVQFLFGDATLTAARGGRLGDVTVDSEDTVDLQFTARRCADISVHLNYLNETPRREWVVETTEGVYHLDMIAQAMRFNEKVESLPVARNDAYLAMHHAVLEQGGAEVCSYEDGMRVMQMIASAEQQIQEAA